MDRRKKPQNETLEKLAEKINRYHGELLQTFKKALEYARMIGDQLLQAKKLVQKLAKNTPALSWQTWADDNTHITKRTRQKYMRIAKFWDKLIAMPGFSEDMGIEAAYKLLITKQNKAPQTALSHGHSDSAEPYRPPHDAHPDRDPHHLPEDDHERSSVSPLTETTTEATSPDEVFITVNIAGNRTGKLIARPGYKARQIIQMLLDGPAFEDSGEIFARRGDSYPTIAHVQWIDEGVDYSAWEEIA